MVSESFLYSEDEADAIVECDEPVTEDSSESDSDDAYSRLPGSSTYVNIDNHTVASRYAAGEPSLPVIDYVHGRQVEVGTKKRKPRIPQSPDSDPEIAISFADMRLTSKPSTNSRRMSSTRLDDTKHRETPSIRRADQQLIRPTFSAPQPSRSRRFRDARTPTRVSILLFVNIRPNSVTELQFSLVPMNFEPVWNS